MLICSNCETAQFLHISYSRIYFADGTADSLESIRETYACTLCGGTGTYTASTAAGVTLTGDITETPERPEAGPFDPTAHERREIERAEADQ